MQTCPTCGTILAYVHTYNEWFCYKCQRYPFHGTNHSYGGHIMQNNSLMDFAYWICISIAILLAFFYIIGLSILNSGILAAELSDTNGIDEPLVIKGMVNIVLSIGLLVSMAVFLRFTINNRRWWKQIKNGLNGDRDEKSDNYLTKSSLSEIIKIPYGTMIVLGLLTIFIGLISVNFSSTVLSYTASIANVLFGPVLVFSGYIMFTGEMKALKKSIYPMID